MAGESESRTGENQVNKTHHRAPLNRRAFIRNGTLFLVGSTLAGAPRLAIAQGDDKPKLRVGLVTDLHYADKPPAINRHYRETSSQARRSRQAVRGGEGRSASSTLGDLIDSADSLEVEKGHLRRIAKDFAAMPGQHHFVLGNHCVSALTKPEFLEIVGQKASFYSFDAERCPLCSPRRLLPKRRRAIRSEELRLDGREHPDRRGRVASVGPQADGSQDRRACSPAT